MCIPSYISGGGGDRAIMASMSDLRKACWSDSNARPESSLCVSFFLYRARLVRSRLVRARLDASQLAALGGV